MITTVFATTKLYISLYTYTDLGLTLTGNMAEAQHVCLKTPRISTTHNRIDSKPLTRTTPTRMFTCTFALAMKNQEQEPKLFI